VSAPPRESGPIAVSGQLAGRGGDAMHIPSTLEACFIIVSALLRPAMAAGNSRTEKRGLRHERDVERKGRHISWSGAMGTSVVNLTDRNWKGTR